ncbi:MAG: zinc dependent phospholipase C family protein [Eubacterium sp.]|nr:zinc dependent phospholipase C family protein [Eubacterium sp.]
MPGFTTHYLFGVNNLKQIRKKGACTTLLHSIGNNKTVFQIGLQGPDIFFYHLASQLRATRPGSIVHKRWTGDFLKCLIEAPEIFWKEEQQQTAQAYAAGFIGHYILDTQMHPYVYDQTGIGEELKKKGYADHIALESDMDASLLMRYAKCLPSAFPYAKTIAFDAKKRDVTADILHYAYQTVFPELSLSKGFLSRAIHSMQIGTRLTYNPHNYKRQVLEAAERAIFGKPQISPVIPSDLIQCNEDPLNLEHRQWKNPWDPKMRSTDSVPDMIKKASGRYQKALRQLDRLYAAGSSDAQYDELLDRLCLFLGNQSFHSGLGWIFGE